MFRKICIAMAFLGVVGANGAKAADPETCRQVRMAEPGWTDLAFTTGIAEVLLDSLGYDASSKVLSIEVIYTGLKDKKLDVFLGYWDPAMVTYYAPFKKDGSVETIHQNLTGAKYTFTVPTYVYQAGVHDISDLHNHPDQFDKKIYGIEPGSNELAISIVKDPKFQLDGWKVVESSEQGMLAEVARAVKRHKWIVFTGWAPHPMNYVFDLSYLSGGDKYYGPDLGGSTVSTQVRTGYTSECPNVTKLLNNLSFNIPFENRGMGSILNDGLSAVDAAKKAIKQHPEMLDGWLKGVTTRDGKTDALSAVRADLGL